MFKSHKRDRLHREIIDFLPRARRRLANGAGRSTEEARLGVLTQLDALEQNMTQGDPAGLHRQYATCRRAIDRALPWHMKFVVRENATTLVLAFLLALVLRAEIVQASYVPSGSMLPTIVGGDQLLVNKLIYGLNLPFTEKKIPLGKPERGDIVVFQNPADPKVDFVKRLVGLPGDTIRLRGMDLIINGRLVERRLLGPTETEDGQADLYLEKLGETEHHALYNRYPGPHQNYDPTLARRYDFCRLDEGYLECEVPDGQYFFMGDNRDNSNDSRFWGFVPESHLRGKATFVHFSWPPAQWLARIGTVLK